MADKTIAWQVGSGDISLSAPDFNGAQELTLSSTSNTGAARTQDIIIRAEDDPTKAITIHVSQAEAARVTVVVQDWTNTGAVCNAAGTVNAYDCDGTYKVQYHQQRRVLEDRYPDGTGAINNRAEFRVGGVASRLHVDGYCGWVRSTVVVADWANTGVLCKANAQAGYDCDGTYSVQYYQQRRTLEDRYPDGSGGINRRDEYRAGPVASRQQVNGQCGYQASRTVNIFINTPSAVLGGVEYLSSGVYVANSFEELELGANTVRLTPGDTIDYVDVDIYNSSDVYIAFYVDLYKNGGLVSSDRHSIKFEESSYVTVQIDHSFDDGDASYEIKFRSVFE